jgi:signal transduction histidine kinase
VRKKPALKESPSEDGDRTRVRILGWAGVVFLILSIGIGAAGFWYYSAQKKSRLADYGRQLGAIADLKIHEIHTWRRERLGDAEVVSHEPDFPQVIKAIQARSKPQSPSQGFRAWLNTFLSSFGYLDAVIFGADGQVLYRIRPAPAENVDAETRRGIAGVLRSGAPALTDLYFPGDSSAASMDILAPIPDPKDASRTIGVLAFRINPYNFLYPLIQTWPTASDSAETLLVRREGEEVVYLNELRHRKGTAGRLRFPLTDSRLPAAKAVSGFSGVVEGSDYRGIPVLAATRAIPDSPWFLVSKVDLDEVLRPVRREGRILALLCFALIGAAGMATANLIRREQVHHLRRERAEQRERLKAEAEVLKLNAELEERVRRRTVQLEEANQELEAFSYSVSHDLRAPLRVIDGFSQALLEDYGGRIDEEGKSHLDRIRSNAQFMGELIDDMLKLARLSKTEIRAEEIDLSRLARESASDIARAYPNRIVDLVIADGLPARSDSHLVRAVLDNLFDNAWKFTAPIPRPRVEFGADLGGKRPVYFIRDNGVGFDMMYVGKLFGIFQRLHDRNEFPGTGIGLATVQRIIHRLGGRVWAEGREGRGATFFFTMNEEERRIG